MYIIPCRGGYLDTQPCRYVDITELCRYVDIELCRYYRAVWIYLTICVTHGRLGALVQLGDSAFMSSLRQSGVVSPAHSHSHCRDSCN